MKTHKVSSTINSIGRTASRNFISGEIVHQMNGTIITENEAEDLFVRREVDGDDFLNYDDTHFLLLDEDSRQFNHSCSPNVGLNDDLQLFALTDIKKGEEIAYDYSTTVGIDYDEWFMDTECNCQSTNCRKIIGCISTLSEETIISYKTKGAIRKYISDQL
ncbi:MAG: SET domain-containing protein-lysine N-methyltransferase [Candidatus Roizmanbacteria bacterium]